MTTREQEQAEIARAQAASDIPLTEDGASRATAVQAPPQDTEIVGGVPVGTPIGAPQWTPQLRAEQPVTLEMLTNILTQHAEATQRTLLEQVGQIVGQL